MQNILRNDNLDFMLANAIKEALCDMAVQDDLPMDLTALDESTLLDKAKAILAKNDHFKLLETYSKLEEFLYVGDIPVEDQYKALMEADENDLTSWVDGVEMVERYETSFTVKQLLETIDQL